MQKKIRSGGPRGAPRGNRNARGNRGGTGRPSRYSCDLIPIVRLIAVGGTSDKEIADAIKISVETLRRWRRERIEFLNGTRVTNEQMAAAARRSLYRRAVGFAYKTEKVFANGFRAKVTEYLPPDVNAAIKILQAYDTKDVWRDKKDVKSENAFGLEDLVAMSMADREERARLKAIEQGKVIETTPVPQEAK
jgi:hypothetical protein